MVKLRTSELSDRGIWWQAAGFLLVGCASVAILEIYAGSDTIAYRLFETAVTRLYWSFIVPLAVAFDGGRRVFEKRLAIHRATREKMKAKERRTLVEVLRRHLEHDEATGRLIVEFTPEVEATLLGKKD